MGLPKGWDAEAHAEWEADRQAEAVGRVLTAIHRAQPATPGLALQASYYLFLLGDFPLARNVLEAARKADPDHLDVLQNLGVMYDRLGANAEARETLEHYVAVGGSSPNAFDGLCAACHRLGDNEAAREWGRRAIESKTRLAEASAPPLDLGKPREDGRRLVSFTLWGSKPRYLRGALLNAIRVPEIYPGFACRFYTDSSVPADLTAALSDKGAELVVDAGEPTQRRRLTRRFLVADDPTVAVYLVRDCDSVVNEREAAAVAEWLNSGKAIHAMRDWWTHTDPMLAGMWGGLGGVLPALESLLADYKSGLVETRNWDQWFLRDRIWPRVHHVAFVHDRLFGAEGSHPFPGPEPTGYFHVGQNESAARSADLAAELAPFREAVPSLAL